VQSFWLPVTTLEVPTLILALNTTFLTVVGRFDIEEHRGTVLNTFLGPAPEAVTNAIFDITKKITQYKISDLPDVSWLPGGIAHLRTNYMSHPQVDLSKLEKHSWQGFEVEIIDNLVDYVELMKQIFDFPAIKALLARPDFKVLFDSLSGGN
jgi:phosphoglucomutase